MKHPPDNNYCPSLEIDIIWHCVMFDHTLYTDICKQIHGRIIPHCLDINEGNDEKRYNLFRTHYARIYSKNPDVTNLNNVTPIESVDVTCNQYIKKLTDRDAIEKENARKLKIQRENERKRQESFYQNYTPSYRSRGSSC